jgi:hypothetical protein
VKIERVDRIGLRDARNCARPIMQGRGWTQEIENV